MSKSEKAIFMNMCMVYDSAGRVLVEDRVGDDWSGIAFPGGHVEPGEPFVDSVIREMKEETGLDVFDLDFCGVRDWVEDDGTRFVVFLYKTSRFAGELVSSEEGEVCWVPLADMPKMKLADGMETIIRLICDNTYSEEFFRKENGEWIGELK